MSNIIQSIRNRLGRRTEEPDRPAAPEMPTTPEADDIAIARDLVRQELRRAEAAFTEHWDEHGDLTGSIDALMRRHGWRTVLWYLETRAPSDVLAFHVDAVTLTECYDILCAEPETESIAYLTGLALAPNIRTLNRVIPVDTAEASAVHAVTDTAASCDILDAFDETGTALSGCGHNHTTEGIPTPSQVDRDHQARLEAVGHDAIGLILSPDGYVRFYSNDLPFTIQVKGKHIEPIGDTNEVFRLGDPVRGTARQLARS